MKHWKEGEKGRAVCERCATVVVTTFKVRDVPFSDGSGVVKDILACVCDNCSEVVGIPAQSTPAIAAARKSIP
jgi:hypothetical protein